MASIPKSALDAGNRWILSPTAMVRELFDVNPDPWQVDILETFPQKPKIAMKACKGPGKHLWLQTIVETPLGPRRWGDLQVGDMLFAEDGSPTRIVGRYDHPQKKLYRVTFDDGSSTLAGGEHLWKVQGRTERRKNLGWAVLSTEEIIARGVTVPNGRWAQKQFIIPRQGPAQFPRAKQEGDPYVVGVWLGDGSVHTGIYTKPYVEVEQEINRRGYETKRLIDGKTVKVRGLRHQLNLIGCLHLRAWEKNIPRNFKYASVEQRRDLLCGLMDTDGTIGKDGHMEFATTSEALANDVVWLVRSLGGVSLIKDTIKEGWYRNEEGEKVECRDCWRVTVVTDFNPFRIAHKAERWRSPLRSKSTERYITRFIASIKEEGVADAMCVEVDHPSHCYLANDFIVTHNTTVLAWLAWNFLLTRHNPNIAATSISGDNLKDGLIKEMSKWYQKAPLLQQAFTITNTRIFANRAEKNWWMSFRTWPKSADMATQADTLAGLHEDNVMFILDEAGGIPVGVLVTAEAALSSCTEGHILIAGNPTSFDGALYYAEKNSLASGGNWYTLSITGDPDDPNRAPRVNVEYAREQIRTHGRDNPWVRVNIFGEFPDSAINTLIGIEEVEAAMKRQYREYDLRDSVRILSADVARHGDDCFDEATEILTDNGWLPFRSLTGAERVFSLRDDKASWEPITKIHCYDFDGEMNMFANRSLDFCVTDRHRMLVKKNPKSDQYKFESFRDLPQEFVVREQNGWSGSNPDEVRFVARDPMPKGGDRVKTWCFSHDDWSQFLGWFVSEGNVYVQRRKNGRFVIQIGQIPGSKQDEIKILLTRMGLRWRIRNDQRAILFTNKSIGEWLISHCGVGASNKRVPQAIRNASERSIRLFLDAFLKGDGTSRSNGMGRMYFTSSKLLADDIQELLAKLGRAGALRLKEKAGSSFVIDGREIVRSHNTYVVYERSFSFGKTVRKKDVRRVHYKGKIWCVSTPFQSIYVRRNGVPMWSGNSSVIARRQGLQMLPFVRYRNLTGMQGASVMNRLWNEFDPDAAFIDATGGFGWTWIEQLGVLGKQAIPIAFNEKATEPDRFYNRRAEMAWKLCDWIKMGGALPGEGSEGARELKEALIQTTYTFKGDRIFLEDKSLIKARLGFSPDEMDAAMLSHAEPVTPRQRVHRPSYVARSDWNPYRNSDGIAGTEGRAYVASSDWNPYR